MMHYENFISYRYLTARKSGFLGFLHTVSVAGVAIGVMALIVVTGIMTGFGNNLRDKIIGTTPHVVVEKETGIPDYAAIQHELGGIAGVVGTSPYIQGNVFLQTEGQAVGLILRGVDPSTEGRVTKIKEYLKQGDIASLDKKGIIIGQELARYGGYKLGDQLTLIAPGSGIAGKGWSYTLNVVGIFNTGMVDYDTGLVVVNLAAAQEIFDMPAGKVSGIGVKIADAYQAPAVKREIYTALGYSFLVKTWIDVNRNLFDALFLEKWGLFLILTLMVLVAAFNIVSTLIVTVMSKIHDIGILQSFGVPRSSIRRIFTKQGMFIGLTGTLWGLAAGLLVSFLLSHYVKVPEQIYSIDRVPVDLQLDDLLIIVVASLMISYLATIYPAARAARLQPVEALRYE